MMILIYTAHSSRYDLHLNLHLRRKPEKAQYSAKNDVFLKFAPLPRIYINKYTLYKFTVNIIYSLAYETMRELGAKAQTIPIRGYK